MKSHGLKRERLILSNKLWTERGLNPHPRRPDCTNFFPAMYYPYTIGPVAGLSPADCMIYLLYFCEGGRIRTSEAEAADLQSTGFVHLHYSPKMPVAPRLIGSEIGNAFNVFIWPCTRPSR